MLQALATMHTILSSLHGRERRQQRGIGKSELHEAVAHGTKSRAHPGRDGRPR